MPARYLAPVPLTGEHDVSHFHSRSREQTEWLRRHARQSNAAGQTRVFVVTEETNAVVLGYFAWRMAELSVESTPQRLRKGAGRFPQPIALLARLAVDETHEGRGLGAAMLVDVISRMLVLERALGCRGLLIHSENDDAKSFYTHLIPGLLESPTDDLHLILFAKDARHSLQPND